MPDLVGTDVLSIWFWLPIVVVIAALLLRWRFGSEATSVVSSPLPVVLPLGAGALTLSFLHERGWYLGDNRFLWNWRPSSLANVFSLWNPQVDIGAPTQHFLPVMGAFLSALHTVGLSPWAAQRCWFALVLGLGAIGLAMLVLALAPSARLEAGIAGMWVLCAPFTIGFFFPTGLLLNALLCPWFILAVWRGLTSDSQWRWAGVVALGVGLSASVNPPGLVFAMIPAFITMLALVVDGRSTIAGAWRWTIRTLVLAVPVAIPVLVLSARSAEALRRNLATTENIEAVSRSSSWSESLRGLGFWLQYWNPRGGLGFPYLGHFFANPWVVVATFVPVAVAMLSLALLQRRVRLLFGLLLATTVMLMVGAFPAGDESPFGRLLNYFYDRSATLYSFRTVYKSGGGWLVAVGVLMALGIRQFRRTEDPRRRRARTLGVVVVSSCVLVTTGWPLLTGSAFDGGQRLQGDVPSYWRDAVDWLDGQPGNGRVLIVPGAQSEEYRWGSAPDGDLFPALLDRPAVFAQPLTGSPADAAGLTIKLDGLLASGRYEAGTLAPMAARLGIQYLVIRNDLNWQVSGSARPMTFEPVRNDPTLRRVAGFGRTGENVTAEADNSNDALGERKLRPIEVFEVPGVSDVVRAVGPIASLLVSGDGAAWPHLARSGALNTGAPIAASATLDSQSIESALADGATVVITDTNRRQSIQFGREAVTLTALDVARVDDLYGTSGSQSVSSFGDADRIAYAGPSLLFETTPPFRPAAAFDGDRTTSWLTGVNSAALGQALEIDLRSPELITEVHLRVAEPAGGRIVTQVAVSTGRQDSTLFEVVAGKANVLRLTGRATDRLFIQVLSVSGNTGGPFGFSEVTIPGLDLRERIVMPYDFALMADSSPRIREQLSTAPVVVEMQRLVGLPYDTESGLARRFRLPVGSTYELVGGATVTAATSAEGQRAIERRPLGECRDDLLTIDGSPVRIVLLEEGDGFQLSSCEDIPLDEGWHELLTAPGVPIDWLRLTSDGGSPSARAAKVDVQVTDRGDDHMNVQLDGPAGTVLFLGQGYSGTWRATSNCELSPAQNLDVQTAWTLKAAGPCTVLVSQAGSSLFTWIVAISLFALAASIVVVIVDPRRRSVTSSAGPRYLPPNLVAQLMAVAFAYGAGDWTMAIVAILAIISIARGWVSTRVLLCISTLLVALAALATIPPWAAPLTPVWPLWPSQRQLASDLARLAIVLAATAMAQSLDPQGAEVADR